MGEGRGRGKRLLGKRTENTEKVRWKREEEKKRVDR